MCKNMSTGRSKVAGLVGSLEEVGEDILRAYLVGWILGEGLMAGLDHGFCRATVLELDPSDR